MKRYQKTKILKDLDKKMVFITGPRQVGKTWLAKEIAGEIPGSLYLNYDRAILAKACLRAGGHDRSAV